MVVPSSNEQVERPEVNSMYWCSCPFGVLRVMVLDINNTHATLSTGGLNEFTVRLSESSFYDEKPAYILTI